MNPISHPPPHAERGLTLVELLVAIVIGLVVVLAATNVVVIGEQHKRSTSGNNESNQGGAYAAYTLDRALRSAGSGFAQAWDQGVFGCRLSAARAGTAILPRTATAFPAPFAGFLGGAGATAAGNLRVAPVLIGQGQSASGSDVLMVMSGNGSAGDAPRPIRSGVPASDNLRMDNTVGLMLNDIGLVSQPGATDCLVEQVGTAPVDEVLPLGGTYFNANGSGLASMAASGTASFLPLGKGTSGGVQFQLFGVNTDRTLVAYDLLRTNGTDTVQPLVDGVAELHAVYGLDTSSPQDNIVDAWVPPSGAYAINAVMTTPALMRQIVAVRLAIVMRSTNYEKAVVTTQRPALFTDQAAITIPAVTYGSTTDNAHFHLRVIDTTIPLRNMLLLP